MKTLCCAAAALALLLAAPAAHATPLEPCDDPPDALCGSIQVPLDRSQPNGPKIPIAFTLLPHTAPGPAKGTILHSEGGPGVSATATAPFIADLYGPALERRDLLLIDLRGTGLSSAIDCDALQHGTGPLLDAIRACGAQLGDSASRFGSADRADDIDDVRKALGIDKLDYYGLSGGGLQVQAYAARHGAHLRTAILDAPYRVGFDDAFQSASVGALLREARLVCGRSPSCRGADRDPERTVAALVGSLRREPIRGTALDADGNPHEVVIDEARVADLLADDSGGFLGASEISAAARAWLERGDGAPLLRMAAETEQPESIDYGDPREYSNGDFYATFCADGVFPFDKSRGEATRRAQYERAVGALSPGAFAPFSVGGWLHSLVPMGDLCVPWPSPVHPRPAIPPDGRFPAVPTLVLTGDLDTAVPSENAAAVAAQFPDAQLVTVANTGHPAAPRSACARDLVARFIETARRVDASCASQFNPTYGVAAFPRQARGASPAPADPAGNDRSRPYDRRVAAMAWAAAYDAIQRSFRMSGDHGAGLRGGAFALEYDDTGLTVHYDGAKFTPDVAVDGTARWDFASGDVDATLTVDGPRGAGGTLRITGRLFPHTASLTGRGTIGGHRVAVLLPTA